MSKRGEGKLWAWMTEEANGKVGMIGAWTEQTGHLPLVGRSESALRVFTPIALKHRATTGQPVWLRCWTVYSDEEDLP